jgi:two-component system, cell cycle sensor histidine kinase and response regulator CckA
MILGLREADLKRILDRFANKECLAILKVVGIYALFGGIWIYSTDSLLALFSLPQPLFTALSIYKGLTFILATSTFLFFLMQKSIYERSLTEDELEQSEERFRSIVDESPTGIHLYQLKKDGRLILIRANSTANKILTIEHKQLIGLSIEEAFPNLIGTGIPALYKKVARGELGIQSFEMPYKDKRFSGVYEVHVFRTGVDTIVVDFTDISERKMTEKAHNLAQLGQMISGIAHEVRNPLAIISGKAELLLTERSLDPTVAENLSLIVKECKRASDMIGRLLKFARPSIGDIKEISAGEIIDNAVKMVEHQYLLKNVKIAAKWDKTMPKIKIDERQMQEVMINLLSNASDAMPEGGTITISAYLYGNDLRLDIADTGTGITEEAMKRIFEPFFTTKENGTGLGLLICKSILLEYGGKITVNSEPGNGTVFSIFIPIKDKTAKV